MPSTGWILMIIFVTLDSVLGYILNFCILVVGVNCLRTGQKLNPPDLINFVLGLVNFLFQCLLSFQSIIAKFHVSLMRIREVYGPISVGMMTLTYFTYWLTSWLCIYYCVTISNFNHPVLVWSKRTISMYLPRLLLLSAAGCFFISLPMNWMSTMEVTLQPAVNSTIDPISINYVARIQPSYMQSASFMGCYVPFLLILISIMVINSSLIRHLWKMRQKNSGLSQTKYHAHVNAIRTMWLFLTISIIFCISEMMLYTMPPNPEDYRTVVNWFIFMSFPAVESLVIVSANPKLRRQIMVKVLCCYRKQ
ncbi:taste receptor type 2 member 143-like [Phyllobates terribilis]|uniref:taste receptor type 2 member 143-like n=1 Tax=Phyllobates terribilis TaxID=111132 RepID=UPI003CCB5554